MDLTHDEKVAMLREHEIRTYCSDIPDCPEVCNLDDVLEALSGLNEQVQSVGSTMEQALRKLEPLEIENDRLKELLDKAEEIRQYETDVLMKKIKRLEAQE